ncbi:hypothetical protein GUJ93_ZPchr0014g46842 [Zizania palustris]|uniref:HMA domain-containing protein n=1 Tax=Zizania palustris TaxID=103762 RepID=A0A8J5W0H6_ZIZPA|nr:hypothetical protein GUJ93_ZPchr0014g46842 [Zizania palustris]
MRKEIVIRLHGSEKGHNKAIKVAAAVSGVESVTLAGEDKNLLLVIGFGVDSNHLTEKLRRKVCRAEVVELRTVDADELLHVAAFEQYPYRYYPTSDTPYNHVAGRDLYYYPGGGYPPQRAVVGRDHYSYTPGGTYPGAAQSYEQYNQQYYYPPAPATTNTHTVVHHQYSNDPDCTIM